MSSFTEPMSMVSTRSSLPAYFTVPSEVPSFSSLPSVSRERLPLPSREAVTVLPSESRMRLRSKRLISSP